MLIALMMMVTGNTKDGNVTGMLVMIIVVVMVTGNMDVDHGYGNGNRKYGC